MSMFYKSNQGNINNVYMKCNENLFVHEEKSIENISYFNSNSTDQFYHE